MNDKTWKNTWPLERVLFTLAGTFTLLSVALAYLVSEWFLLFTAFVALNQLLYAAAGFCGMSLILGRLTSLRGACATEGVAR